MSNARPRGVDRSGEGGAALVQMTIAMLAITAFSTFVMDYGVFWVARRQAQNAADAGALAGAIAVAFGENPNMGGSAMLASQAAARANLIWGEPPSVLLGGLNGLSDVRIGPCTSTPTHQCVATDVFRTAGRTNPLPTYFGRLAEIDTQDVQATATAEVMTANESACVQHWGIADHWTDDKGDWWSTAITPMWICRTRRLTRPRARPVRAAGFGWRTARVSCARHWAATMVANCFFRTRTRAGLEQILWPPGRRWRRLHSGALDDSSDRLRHFLNPRPSRDQRAIDAGSGACWSNEPGCGRISTNDVRMAVSTVRCTGSTRARES